jgi:glycosyltransferase involved in cell wall biosynthesis
MEKTDIKVSFTILTHNEGPELKRILDQISTFKTLWDEVIIVDDYSTNEETIRIHEWAKNDAVLQAKVIQRHTEGDMVAQRNFANKQCKNEYIFSIDADELLESNLAKSFREILVINNDVEYFRLPRVNKVSGISITHVSNWHWGISSLPSEIEEKPLEQQSDEYKLIKAYNLIISENNGIVKFYTPIVNWPDMQGRIFKNSPDFYYLPVAPGSIHETIKGYKKYANFPLDKKFAILHYKEIQKQEQQNAWYAAVEGQAK